ncbi:MAG: hypothetical protein PHS92_00730 [Candidatus Gracilibacteria bacterium]|nr:hypothetical protein [Candidatus Gracilibacteria bacterium]
MAKENESSIGDLGDGTDFFIPLGCQKCTIDINNRATRCFPEGCYEEQTNKDRNMQ